MEAEKYCNSLFKNATIGIYQCKLNGTAIHINPAFARILGYDNEQDLIESIANIVQLYVYPDQRKEMVATIEAHGYIENFITQVYKKDKTKIWISEDSWVIRDDNGKIAAFQGVVKNITPKRILEERMAKKQKAANRSNKIEAIRTMARGISHDFNNILSPIVGYTEMLLEFDNHDEKTERYLNNILKTVNKAVELSSRIHSLAQPDNIKTQPVKLDKVIDEVVEKLSITLPPNITIEQNIAHDLHPVLTDPSHMYYILVNLCTNAYLSMENSGGNLVIKMHQGELDSQYINDELLDISPGEFVIIHINDTGVEIPPHALERIFDPYFSLYQKSRDLGLSLSYSLIKQYDGDIQIKSSENKGTFVTCYLPTFDTFINKNNKPEKPAKHIMLVDDDKDILDIQKKLIEHLGYKVTAFPDGPRALKSFIENPASFDLVLTDMNMPEMSGLDLSKSILNIDANKPIILCTGFSDSVDEKMAKRVGIKKFILKPLTTQKLSNDLGSVLDN